MARLWLVRHSQAGAVDGDYDRLSPLGERQATLLGNYFISRQLHFDLAQSGQLRRQRQTLEKVLEHNPASHLANADNSLDELPFQALTRCWAAQQDASLGETPLADNLSQVLRGTLSAWIEGRLLDAPMSWQDFRGAALHWLERTRAQHHNANDLLVVSSGGTMGTILAALVDAPDLSMLRFNLQLRNTAICEIDLRPRRAHLISFNNLPHLELVEGGKLLTLI